MPRTVAEILAQADELAKRFEDRDLPGTPTEIDGAPLRAVREAFEDFALAQRRLAERVSVARAMGHSWASIGSMIGTTGEAARQRYGPPATPKAATKPRASSTTVRAKVPKAKAVRFTMPKGDSAIAHYGSTKTPKP